MVKTTVGLPEDLWRVARIKAMGPRQDPRSVIIAALEAHLKANPTRGGT